MTESPLTPVPVAGSWRDPGSRVFHHDAAVLRSLSPEGLADYEAASGTTSFRGALDRGDIVDTWVEDRGRLSGDWAGVLGHRRIPVVAYPFEWSFSMLKDAARLHLDLLRALLDDGVWTKDASSYNILFDGVRPVFIDVGSFQPLPDGEPWPGYRQFCQTFLYPLLVEAHLDLRFQPLLRSSVNGIDPAMVNAMFRGRSRLRRGVPVHVVAHARAERRFGSSSREVSSVLRDAGVSRRVYGALIERLRRVVESLAAPSAETAWSGYSDRNHYPSEALTTKERFVTEALSARRHRLVLDLGCNDGHFARIAADHADQVVAVDSDATVIDTLYRSIRDSGGPTNLLPLVVSATDPSPAIGWRSRERGAFSDRVRPDFVLCLALVHHLAVGAGVPLGEVVEYLAAFGSDLVVEIPDLDDPMVQTLIGGRRGPRHPYGVDEFRSVAADRFTIEREQQLPGVPRTMFCLSPRTS